jgi:hypothetical protein
MAAGIAFTSMQISTSKSKNSCARTPRAQLKSGLETFLQTGMHASQVRLETRPREEIRSAAFFTPSQLGVALRVLLRVGGLIVLLLLQSAQDVLHLVLLGSLVRVEVDAWAMKVAGQGGVTPYSA